MKFLRKGLPEAEWLKCRDWYRGNLHYEDISADKSVLVVVDMQNDIFDLRAHYKISLAQGRFAEASAKRAIKNTRLLQDFFRKQKLPIIIVTLWADRPGPGYKIIEELKPKRGEYVVNKNVSGAFGPKSELLKVLKKLSSRTLFVCGAAFEFCVSSTVRGAGDYGYNVVLVPDACMSNSSGREKAALHLLRNYSLLKTAKQVVADYPWTTYK